MVDYFGWERGIVLLGCSCLIAFSAKKFWSLPILVAWIGFSALRVFAFPLSSSESLEWATLFDHTAAASLITFLVISLAAFSTRASYFKIFFQGIFLFNSAMLCIGHFFDAPYGILLNPSMSGCFSVALAPLFFKEKYPQLMLTICFLSVLSSGQSQPVGLFAALLLIYTLWRHHYKTAVSIAVVGSLTVLYLKDSDAFSSSGRFQLWQDTYTWFEEHGNLVLGQGGGSFSAIGPYITRKYPPKSMFIWLHSDWLQLIFEQGAIGFILGVTVLIAALRNAAKQFELFCGVIVFALWMVANFPIHLALSGLYGAFLIRCVFDEEDPQAV